MKKSERLKKEAERTMEKIRGITRHIRNVEDNCLLLGEKLIISGEIDLGHRLISNGFVHDASKFSGIEWDNMAPGQSCQEEGAKLKLKMAIHHHNSTNFHHPEAWSGGIKEMPDVYVCEMLCDWKSRSEEFGTDLREWINDSATKKWNFTKEDEIYKKLMKYTDMLCDKPFEDLSKIN